MPIDELVRSSDPSALVSPKPVGANVAPSAESNHESPCQPRLLRKGWLDDRSDITRHRRRLHRRTRW